MKKKILVSAVSVGLILLIINFPVYRLLKFRNHSNYFSKDEIQKAIYIGTPWDRAQSKEIMDLANKAFSDCGHSKDENSRKYGKLSYYASSTDYYPETVKTNYSLKLWSAHLGKNDGYLWVYYSKKGLDKNGNVDYASLEVVSLWKVEKNQNGTWEVTEIKEHP